MYVGSIQGSCVNMEETGTRMPFTMEPESYFQTTGISANRGSSAIRVKVYTWLTCIFGVTGWTWINAANLFA